MILIAGYIYINDADLSRAAFYACYPGIAGGFG